jgi:hypothetical protein
MSEVDRLSNSGLYPALPIADKKSRRDGSNQQQPPAEQRPSATPSGGDSQGSKAPRPPKSLIDDYA